MPGNYRIGFIGYGEVASVFSQPLKENGAEIYAYDILLDQNGGEGFLKKRVAVEGIHFTSLPAVVKNSTLILSTATTQVAKAIAKECAKTLKPGQIFVDLNSSAPSLKAEINRIILPSGAGFVEGAILGAVGASGATTHILTGGPKGKDVANILCNLGLNVSFFHQEIGKASLFKMLRSIFSKGVEGLLLELLISGRRAGIEEELWKDITGLMSKTPFEVTASNWIRSHVVAHERRYYEMAQVVETMKEIGVEPIITAGTKAFFHHSLELGLKEAFPEKPATIEAVIEFMEKNIS